VEELSDAAGGERVVLLGSIEGQAHDGSLAFDDDRRSILHGPYDATKSPGRSEGIVGIVRA
jgi:hypothetical protein